MTKKFVLAPDSFKESMSAKEACLAMEKGILAVFKDADIQHVPMADGGEGTVDSLVDVEPTAKPIKIPEIGAKKVPEIPITEIKWTICVDKSETEINPAIAPAPIKIKTVSVTLFKPEDA